MRIAIALFDGFTATDAIGPYEVLSRLPGAQLAFVASRPGLTRSAPPAVVVMVPAQAGAA